jgi:mannose-6-phosphate isomerase-like protein (cupin superfamily)
MIKKNFSQGRKIKFEGETIYEIDMKDSTVGAALAEIKKSKEHFHRKTKEWYYVIEGRGEIYIDGRKIPLKKNDFIFIPTKSRHFARGKMKVLAITSPPWSKKDHHLVI